MIQRTVKSKNVFAFIRDNLNRRHLHTLTAKHQLLQLIHYSFSIHFYWECLARHLRWLCILTITKFWRKLRSSTSSAFDMSFWRQRFHITYKIHKFKNFVLLKSFGIWNKNQYNDWLRKKNHLKSFQSNTFLILAIYLHYLWIN